MPIELICHHCGRRVGLQAEVGGDRLLCPQCHTELLTPSTEPLEPLEPLPMTRPRPAPVQPIPSANSGCFITLVAISVGLIAAFILLLAVCAGSGW